MGVPCHKWVCQPKDAFFNNISNKWNKNGYDKICREFNVYNNTDFRFTAYENDGLGRIYKKMFGKIHDVTVAYDKEMNGKLTNKWPNGFFHFD